MKILSAPQIRELDQYTIQHEPIASVDLMERAASRFFDAVFELIHVHQPVYVFCGTGNNGGDGLAVARMLVNRGWSAVHVYLIHHSPKASPDFLVNHDRLKEISMIRPLIDAEHFPKLEKNAVIIDAIFGSGLTRAVKGLAAEIIQAINQSGAKVYSIDLPSGLFCDQLNKDSDAVIHSSVTFTFHSPKLSFLFPQNGKYVPGFRVLDIGLSDEFEQQLSSNYEFTDEKWIRGVLKPRAKFSHKGTYGHALLCAGSYGKMGAAVLSVSAALKSGAGLVSACIPGCGYEIMQITNPEAMVLADKNEKLLESTGHDYSKFSAVGLGPGIGQDKKTVAWLEFMLKETGKPLVIDADALNIIAASAKFKKMLPAGSILTPHPGEFKRLAGEWKDDLDRLDKQIEFSKRHKVVLVLKGANTSVSTPAGKVYFNSTGNPGMAKGGSGDALTGIITALLAQGYSPEQAAIVAVFIHGSAGDEAALHLGETGMDASDIIHYIPSAFKEFE